jgi:hypothetical protein
MSGCHLSLQCERGPCVVNGSDLVVGGHRFRRVEDAADMVLADDNLASILAAEEGHPVLRKPARRCLWKTRSPERPFAS